jgi:hypothetical protein
MIIVADPMNMSMIMRRVRKKQICIDKEIREQKICPTCKHSEETVVRLQYNLPDTITREGVTYACVTVVDNHTTIAYMNGDRIMIAGEDRFDDDFYQYEAVVTTRTYSEAKRIMWGLLKSFNLID